MTRLHLRKVADKRSKQSQVDRAAEHQISWQRKRPLLAATARGLKDAATLRFGQPAKRAPCDSPTQSCFSRKPSSKAKPIRLKGRTIEGGIQRAYSGNQAYEPAGSQKSSTRRR